jgi:hypothetical protein
MTGSSGSDAASVRRRSRCRARLELGVLTRQMETTCRSQDRIQGLIDVRPQGVCIHGREQSQPGQKRLRRQGRTRHGTQLGHGLAGARDRDPLSASGAIGHVAAVIAQVSVVDVLHATRIACSTRCRRSVVEPISAMSVMR